jgi:putative transposase
MTTNHAQLCALGEAPGGVSGWMQSVGRRYVRYVNATYGRSGTLFKGRYQSSLVESERYLLTCMRCIEQNGCAPAWRQIPGITIGLAPARMPVTLPYTG